jgi:DNA-binding sugar fermentation-stimulating protein
MERAEKHLRKLGYAPQDKHKTKPYDFLCQVKSADLYVEVNGTQDSARSVSLSPNEVEYARKHKNSALFIVHSVRVKGKRKPVVSGG